LANNGQAAKTPRKRRADTTPAMRPVNLSMPTALVEIIEDLARREKVIDEGGEPNRSRMIRILVARGLTTWMPGWRPKR
jgi:hypothetical protein